MFHGAVLGQGYSWTQPYGHRGCRRRGIRATNSPARERTVEACERHIHLRLLLRVAGALRIAGANLIACGRGRPRNPSEALAFERPLRARLLRVCCAFAARLSAPRSNSLGAGGRVRGSDGRAHGRRDGSAGRVGRRTAGGRTSGLQARMAGSDRGAGGRADVSDERVGVAAGRMVPSAMQALTRFAIVLADGTRAS